MTTVADKTFTFAELDERTKDKVRDQHRDDAFYDDWWDAVYEDAIRMGALLGIEIGTKQRRTMNNKTISYPAINFSGFCSQGDGACYEGNYRYAKDAVAKVTAEAPQDKELARIATELTALQVGLKLLYGWPMGVVIKHGSSNYRHPAAP